MKDVIGVRFRTNGKIYYFDPKDYNVPEGCYVIVETARGIELGEVAVANRMISEDKIVSSLKKASISFTLELYSFVSSPVFAVES